MANRKAEIANVIAEPLPETSMRTNVSAYNLKCKRLHNIFFHMADSTPTLLDVARIAGVSTATVSRYFNTPDRVVPATREKVQRVVKELGYTPHFGGRALASNRTNTVGAVIPTMDNSIFARGLQAFPGRASSKPVITLLVASSNYDPEKELEQLQSLISRGSRRPVVDWRSPPGRDL